MKHTKVSEANDTSHDREVFDRIFGEVEEQGPGLIRRPIIPEEGVNHAEAFLQFVINEFRKTLADETISTPSLTVITKKDGGFQAHHFGPPEFLRDVENVIKEMADSREKFLADLNADAEDVDDDPPGGERQRPR